MVYYKINRFILLYYTFLCVTSVNSWKTCSQTFCKTVRNTRSGSSGFWMDLDTIKVFNKYLIVDIKAVNSTKHLKLRLEARTDTTFRLTVYDSDLPPKFNEIISEPKLASNLRIENASSRNVTVNNINTKAIMYENPIKIEFYSFGKLMSVFNAEDRIVFKNTIAVDILFPGAQRAYGLPQHAENLALQTTTIDNREPYRLFNLDYGKYKVKSPEALYGSVPVLYAHGIEKSSGVFWNNGAQTWVDITVAPNAVNAFFMSENSIFDLLVFTGPTFAEAVQQYAHSTGVAPLPQYFALGYHQSRYSYMSEKEVLEVVENFDKNSIPLDSVWLDIDYTDKMKYFTWDPIRFPNPLELQTKLEESGRRLITIIDPHIKKEKGYFVHDNATENNYYVKYKNKYYQWDYIAKCWPGESSWLDFKNPDARNYYKSLYSLETFKSRNVHIWNDMNEPAIFDDKSNENTIPGDAIHSGNWKHRELHNEYGYYQTLATFQGLIDRFGSEENAVRPFILTRSHFAGSQRFAAIWTGDNYASWEYLQISYPMCLTSALSGISFCGADVGGFGGVPDDELYQRWYQAGAWLPFFRGHSGKDVPRREPYLYSNDIKSRVKEALHQRYIHLPYWYTLFWEHMLSGEPIIRPLTYHYPNEKDAFDIDNQILVGKDILVAPVMEKGATTISVYFPGGPSEIWLDIKNLRYYHGLGITSYPVNLDSIGVFYRGGSIISRKDQWRSSASATKSDDFTLYVCLDVNNEATGTLYIDDYETYNYKYKKEYAYAAFSYKNGVLTSKMLGEGNYKPSVKVQEVVIFKPPKNVSGVQLKGDRQEYGEIHYKYYNGNLIISNLNININKPMEMELLFK